MGCGQAGRGEEARRRGPTAGRARALREGAWRDSWRSVTDLTTDMRKRARVMERVVYAGDERGRERDEPGEGRATRSRFTRGISGEG